MFHAIWYRSPMEIIDLGEPCIKPIGPLETYNPFEKYYPYSQGSREQKALHFQFLTVDADNPQEVLKFCQRYGVLGSGLRPKKFRPDDEFLLASILGLFAGNPKACHSFGDPDNLMSRWNVSARTWVDFTELLSTNPKELVKKYIKESSEFPQEDIYTTMSISEFKDQQALMKYTLGYATQQQNQEEAILQEMITGIVNANLLYISPRLRWDAQDAQWGLTWNTTSLIGILWLMVLFDLLSPGKFHSCPRCHQFFLANSPRVRFCSQQCGNVFKVQKYLREKKKSERRPQNVLKTRATKSTEKKK
jgi:hypothetical protein